MFNLGVESHDDLKEALVYQLQGLVRQGLELPKDTLDRNIGSMSFPNLFTHSARDRVKFYCEVLRFASTSTNPVPEQQGHSTTAADSCSWFTADKRLRYPESTHWLKSVRSVAAVAISVLPTNQTLLGKMVQRALRPEVNS
jgi:hypothetical protein